jgi:hypothetical protein
VTLKIAYIILYISILSAFKIIIKMKKSPGGNPTMQNRSKFYHRFKLPLSLLALFLFFVTACMKDEVFHEQELIPEQKLIPEEELAPRSWHSPEMVNTWNQALEAMYTFPTNALSKSQPPVARIFAIYHLAIHDALNCITPRYERYVGVDRDKDADPDAAVAQAAYDVIAVVKYP